MLENNNFNTRKYIILAEVVDKYYKWIVKWWEVHLSNKGMLCYLLHSDNSQPESSELSSHNDQLPVGKSTNYAQGQGEIKGCWVQSLDGCWTHE